MRYRKLGSSDLEVSEIALGSWLTYAGGIEWLRFTKSGTSAVHGEYSSDGTTWQAFGDDVYPFVLDQVSVALRMGTYGMDSQYVAWDNLNTLTCPP